MVLRNQPVVENKLARFFMADGVKTACGLVLAGVQVAPAGELQGGGTRAE